MADPITQFLSSPAKGRNLLIGIVLLLSAVGFGSLIYWNNRPDYQVLYTNLSQEDGGEILGKLKETDCNKEKAAALLGITRKMLSDRVRKYHIKMPKKS